jgi:hypothetical protein
MSSADGTYLRQLTADPAADESPDWQTIPAPDTDRRCGDLEDAVDVRAAGRRQSCPRALRLVRAWLTGQRRVLRHYDATVDDFGGTKRVQLIRDHHGRDRKNGRDREKLVVFLVEPR